MNWVIIGSGNGLSPVRCQAIIWSNAGLLSIGLLGTHFSECIRKCLPNWRQFLYWGRWVKVMACRLLRDCRPSSEPMLIYYQVLPPNKLQWSFNQNVTGGFSSQRVGNAGVGVFFDIILNVLLNKPSSCRWFGTPWHPLWRHCNDIPFSAPWF